MKLKQFLVPLASGSLILTATAGCGKPKKSSGGSYKSFSDEIQMVDHCNDVITQPSKIGTSDDEVTCSKYLTGSISKGGLTLDQHFTCSTDISKMTHSQIAKLFADHDMCYLGRF